MIDRLDRMRTWIQSRHFPDELRITILEEPDVEAVARLDGENLAILPTLVEALEHASGMLRASNLRFQTRRSPKTCHHGMPTEHSTSASWVRNVDRDCRQFLRNWTNQPL